MHRKNLKNYTLDRQQCLSLGGEAMLYIPAIQSFFTRSCITL